MNITRLKESLPYLFEGNIATLIIGHHGVGKSQAIKQYTKAKNIGFIDLRLGTQDVGDLLGLADFQKNEKGENVATTFMRPKWFPTDPDSEGIIFMDEINRGRRDVLQAVFQLCLDKRLHEYELPKGWHVVAAMNPSTADYIVTDISDKAFLDRFCHIKLAPSKQEWFSYADASKMDKTMVQFLKDQPEMLSAKLEEFSLEVTPSRRSWEAVDRLLKAKTPINILPDLVSGLVGTTASTAFIKAMNSNDKPISGAEILNSYDKVKAKIKTYSSAKTGGRQDMLKFTADSLTEALTGRSTKNPLNAVEAKNLSDFLVDIPKDLAFDLCRNLYMEEVVRPVIDDHKELLAILANGRNMKIEGINT